MVMIRMDESYEEGLAAHSVLIRKQGSLKCMFKRFSINVMTIMHNLELLQNLSSLENR